MQARGPGGQSLEIGPSLGLGCMLDPEMVSCYQGRLQEFGAAAKWFYPLIPVRVMPWIAEQLFRSIEYTDI